MHYSALLYKHTLSNAEFALLLLFLHLEMMHNFLLHFQKFNTRSCFSSLKVYFPQKVPARCIMSFDMLPYGKNGYHLVRESMTVDGE